MTAYSEKTKLLNTKTYKWLITGVAGFIGSNLLETLLKFNQKVIGIDNFSTGHKVNLRDVEAQVTSECWKNFTFFEGDIRSMSDCQNVCSDVDYVLHQAALGSVPRSIKDPILTNENNISGFLNILVASRDANVKRFVYAASSSTYGDHPALPKHEEIIGNPLSPYAVTKYVNELYAGVFAKVYNFETIGLRYFNVFGARQDPEGSYAAVIPKWVDSFLRKSQPIINGNGETSRDFCFVNNAIQANILAALADNPEATDQVYNVAVGDRTSLNDLFWLIQEKMQSRFKNYEQIKPEYRDFRSGDVLHSQADITKARDLLGYEPEFNVDQGLDKSIDWYISKFGEIY